VNSFATVKKSEFDAVYDRLILRGGFFEQPGYYRIRRDRYWNTFRYFAALPLEHPASLLEIGGGQVALLAQEIFRDRATVGDISEDYAEAVTRHGVDFVYCDLTRAIPEGGQYDVIVLCEVIEHLPVPLHSVLEQLVTLLKPGGFLFMTTPNLYRLRNVVRMALGKPLFCHWYYPEAGQSLGHVTEFSREHLLWQMERAGLHKVRCEITQLVERGHTALANMGRRITTPLLHMRPLWRDNLVAWGRKSSIDE
jgi:2-polyprenyl-3-methyl-5-hydroxy-6-metoxy-1,4-benzoquinol methylase